MESSNRPSKDNRFINFMAQKKTVFPITEKSKTRTFQQLVNTIFHQLFGSKKDRISHLGKVQNMKFSVISKYHLSIISLAQKNIVPYR